MAKPEITVLRIVGPICLTITLITTGCDRETPPVLPKSDHLIEQDGLIAERVDGGIRLANNRSEPVAFLIWNRSWLGQVARCIDTTPNCLRLAAGSQMTVRDADILGFERGAAEAVVLFWRVLPNGADGFRAEDIREVVIRL